MSDLKLLIDTIKRGNYVVLDTETTGLGWDAQIVQIAVIDPQGQVLLDTFVHPTCPIPPDATAVHGITDDMVSAAPYWDAVYDQLCEAVQGKDVIIYNADYDTRLIDQTNGAHTERLGGDFMFFSPEMNSVVCAMLAYAEHYGDYDHYHGNYRWQRLATAVRQCKLNVDGAHHALGDCRMTLAVCKHLLALADAGVIK